MYAVKRSGRNGWYFYTREMQEKSERRHRLYNELVGALDNGRIVAHLPAAYSSVQTGRIVSCEALARWQRQRTVPGCRPANSCRSPRSPG